MSKASEEKEKAEKDRPLTETVRELALTGIAAVFMTEDSVRKYLKELKIPKEVMGYFMEGVGKKEDVYKTIGVEVGKVLNKIDIAKEFSRFLETHKVNIEAKLSFEKKEEDSAP